MSVPALQARQLGVRLGDRPVLHGLNVSVTAGRWTCVVGPNGAGKTTLLKALAGLCTAEGEVLWQGQRLASLSRAERARRLAWLGQGEGWPADLRVADVVMLGRLPHQGWWSAPSAVDHAVAKAALQATQTWDCRHRNLQALSAGERQRVLLARAMAVQAPCLLMDEPLANLDPPHQVDWLEQMHCLLAQGTTVLTVLHEIGMALHADEAIVMAQGQVVHQGACADPATHRAIEAVFDHRIRILPLENQWTVLPALR